ncbi:MAG: hypothetical protein ACOCVV_08250 [Marinobacter sp.]
MFWNFVATIICGLGAAGIAMGIRAATRKKAPKWIIPVFAGLGMMGYQIYMEYTWHDQITGRLPGSSVVVSTEAAAEFWRPWSFFVPQVNRITVLDRDSLRTTPGGRDTLQFRLYHFRQTYGDRVTHGGWLLNCPSRELVALDDVGRPDTSHVRRLGTEDRLLREVCD